MFYNRFFGGNGSICFCLTPPVHVPPEMLPSLMEEAQVALFHVGENEAIFYQGGEYHHTSGLDNMDDTRVSKCNDLTYLLA